MKEFFSKIDPWIIVISVIFACEIVVRLIAWCKIFKKAGIHPGKLFIPVYGFYLMYDISKSKKLFSWIVIMGLLRLVSSACSSIFAQSCNSGGYYDYSTLLVLDSIDILFSSSIVVIVVLHIISLVRLTHLFRKKGWFSVGVILLRTVFLCILGFGTAEYKDYDYEIEKPKKPIHIATQAEEVRALTLPEKRNADTVIIPEGKMRCSKCGKIQNRGRHICWECGAIFIDDEGTVEGFPKDSNTELDEDVEREERTDSDSPEKEKQEEIEDLEKQLGNDNEVDSEGDTVGVSDSELDELGIDLRIKNSVQKSPVEREVSKELVFCRYCGFRLLDNSEFCSHCGKKVL